jgi:hypothetical protein
LARLYGQAGEKNSNIEIRILNILIFSGLILYLVNYAIGWLLYFKRIRMTKRTHQIFYASIIFNLSALLFFAQIFSAAFFICLGSLVMMLILPFGKKGGKFHIFTSSTGLMLYGFFVYLYI